MLRLRAKRKTSRTKQKIRSRFIDVEMETRYFRGAKRPVCPNQKNSHKMKAAYCDPYKCLLLPLVAATSSGCRVIAAAK